MKILFGKCKYCGKRVHLKDWWITMKFFYKILRELDSPEEIKAKHKELKSWIKKDRK